jgi:hypothetical protein
VKSSSDKFQIIILERAMTNFLSDPETTSWCDRMRQQDAEWADEEILERMLMRQAPGGKSN